MSTIETGHDIHDWCPCHDKLAAAEARVAKAEEALAAIAIGVCDCGGPAKFGYHYDECFILSKNVKAFARAALAPPPGAAVRGEGKETTNG